MKDNIWELKNLKVIKIEIVLDPETTKAKDGSRYFEFTKGNETYFTEQHRIRMDVSDYDTLIHVLNSLDYSQIKSLKIGRQ